MTATRPDAHPCQQCRQAFASPRSLRRHHALDHRAAPDGERLTSLLVGDRTPPPATDGLHATSAAAARAQGPVVVPESPHPPARPGPGAAHDTDGVPMTWIALLLLLALVAGVLGTLLEMALWAVGLVVLVLLAGGAVLARGVGRTRVDRR